MIISLYIVILLTGLFIFFICVCADSSLLIFDVGCIVGFFYDCNSLCEITYAHVFRSL